MLQARIFPHRLEKSHHDHHLEKWQRKLLKPKLVLADSSPELPREDFRENHNWQNNLLGWINEDFSYRPNGWPSKPLHRRRSFDTDLLDKGEVEERWSSLSSFSRRQICLPIGTQKETLGYNFNPPLPCLPPKLYSWFSVRQINLYPTPRLPINQFHLWGWITTRLPSLVDSIFNIQLPPPMYVDSVTRH